MTPPTPRPILYFHPTLGWCDENGRISEEEAEILCRKRRIPFFRSPDAPDRFDPVLEVTVAGMVFIPGVGKILKGIKEGDILDMEREDNPHDSNAILLLDAKGRKAGYVPKVSNSVIARLMDLGEKFHARVLSVDPGDPYMRVELCMRRGKCCRRHFSMSSDCMAGDFIQMDGVPVTKSSFRYHKMSGDRRELTYRRHLSEDDRWDLRWGHRSLSMDDRWNLVCIGRRLHFCRSWTGNCIFILELGKGDEHRLFVENDKSVCNFDEESALEDVDHLLNYWLEPIPIPSDMIPDGVYGNFVRGPSTNGEVTYRVDDDGTVHMFSRD